MFSNKIIRTSRTGFSIIEVLTSIVVAMIGVFGVMAMIPFAVKQAQTGLDSDAATVVARNAFDQFEISGYRGIAKNTTTGYVNEGKHEFNWTADGMVRQTLEDPEVFFLDPLGITENGNDYTNTTFPFHPVTATGGTAYPTGSVYEIRPINLVVTPLPPPAPPRPMSIAEARRMFRSTDKLVFGESVDSALGGDADLNGPQQIFDVGAGGVPLRRQSEGTISWSAIVVPVRDGTVSTSAWKYRMYILVYKDRVTDLNLPDSQMVTTKIDGTKTPDFQSPLSTVYLSNAGVKVEDGILRKNDWVMLINEDDTLHPSTPDGFKLQLAFCRVVAFADGFGGATPVPPTITLDGPDFEFGPAANSRDTHIVHLKDVVGVYERTFTPEGASNWNVSF